jgi:hypothetical protein
MDQIFHLLDGAGLMRSHHGPFSAAITTSGPKGTGSTDYFKFRCCKNGNLHLESLREDLLKEFNRRAGAANLGRDHKPEDGELVKV